MMSLMKPREKLLALHGKVAEEKSRCRSSKIIRLAERYLTGCHQNARESEREKQRKKQADHK